MLPVPEARPGVRLRDGTPLKYWDEDYVRGLEVQVQSLLSLLIPDSMAQLAAAPGGGEASCSSTDIPATPDVEPTGDRDSNRSRQAMEELRVMLWRTNVGFGVTIIGNPANGSVYCLDVQQQPSAPVEALPPDPLLKLCEDPALLHSMVSLFLENINREHQFTSYTTPDFLLGFPYQSPTLAFLHSAILALGCTFSNKDDATAVGDVFQAYAESLVFSCCRNEPSLVILRLSMLSWRSLALGRDHFARMFISMAAGMCVQLRVHVLVLEECASRTLHADIADKNDIYPNDKFNGVA
ncbi:DNA binding [Microdochium nivale]|nr:DNA binding [Microdochium nivale]